MRKVKSDAEILRAAIRIEGSTILDIECGTGDLVQWMSSEGGYAVGMDVPDMLAKAIRPSSESNVRYVAGFARDRGVAWDAYTFRSICRINILEKRG